MFEEAMVNEMKNFTMTGYRSPMFETFLKMIPIDKQMAILEIEDYSWVHENELMIKLYFKIKIWTTTAPYKLSSVVLPVVRRWQRWWRPDETALRKRS